jgi:hypothetical protein
MKLFYLAALCTAFILASCSTEKLWLKKLQPGSVPTDVKNSKYILLVEKPTWSKSQMKELEKCMTEDYPGKFEIIPAEDLKLAKYSDTTKYRYFLMRSRSGYVVERSATAPGGSNSSAADRIFWSDVKDKDYVADQIFVDRKLNKDLPSTGMRMSSFSWPVKFLVHHIQTM